MKLSIIKKIIVFVVLLMMAYSLTAAETYSPGVEKYHRVWNHLIPRYTKLQYAGSMGFMSVGTGWQYGSNHQWETDLLLGIVPRYSSKRAKATLTLKQNFMPWNVELNDRWSLEPLASGLYVTTLLDNEFWTKEPEKYPSGYYGFSTKLRANIFVGQRLSFSCDKNNPNKKVTLFYELSTSDMYFISAATNKYINPRDVLSLSFGVKIQLF